MRYHASVSAIKFSRRGNHVTRDLAGETLVVPIRGGAAELDFLYVFNDSGAFVWRLLETPRTLDQLAHALTEEFDIEGAAAHDDITGLLDELRAAGLVEAGEAPASR